MLNAASDLCILLMNLHFDSAKYEVEDQYYLYSCQLTL